MVINTCTIRIVRHLIGLHHRGCAWKTWDKVSTSACLHVRPTISHPPAVLTNSTINIYSRLTIVVSCQQKMPDLMCWIVWHGCIACVDSYCSFKVGSVDLLSIKHIRNNIILSAYGFVYLTLCTIKCKVCVPWLTFISSLIENKMDTLWCHVHFCKNHGLALIFAIMSWMSLD